MAHHSVQAVSSIGLYCTLNFTYKFKTSSITAPNSSLRSKVPIPILPEELSAVPNEHPASQLAKEIIHLCRQMIVQVAKIMATGDPNLGALATIQAIV